MRWGLTREKFFRADREVLQRINQTSLADYIKGLWLNFEAILVNVFSQQKNSTQSIQSYLWLALIRKTYLLTASGGDSIPTISQYPLRPSRITLSPKLNVSSIVPRIYTICPVFLSDAISTPARPHRKLIVVKHNEPVENLSTKIRRVFGAGLPCKESGIRTNNFGW